MDADIPQWPYRVDGADVVASLHIFTHLRPFVNKRSVSVVKRTQRYLVGTKLRSRQLILNELYCGINLHVGPQVSQMV